VPTTTAYGQVVLNQITDDILREARRLATAGALGKDVADQLVFVGVGVLPGAIPTDRTPREARAEIRARAFAAMRASMATLLEEAGLREAERIWPAGVVKDRELVLDYVNEALVGLAKSDVGPEGLVVSAARTAVDYYCVQALVRSRSSLLDGTRAAASAALTRMLESVEHLADLAVRTKDAERFIEAAIVNAIDGYRGVEHGPFPAFAIDRARDAALFAFARDRHPAPNTMMPGSDWAAKELLEIHLPTCRRIAKSAHSRLLELHERESEACVHAVRIIRNQKKGLDVDGKGFNPAVAPFVAYLTVAVRRGVWEACANELNRRHPGAFRDSRALAAAEQEWKDYRDSVQHEYCLLARLTDQVSAWKECDRSEGPRPLDGTSEKLLAKQLAWTVETLRRVRGGKCRDISVDSEGRVRKQAKDWLHSFGEPPDEEVCQILGWSRRKLVNLRELVQAAGVPVDLDAVL